MGLIDGVMVGQATKCLVPLALRAKVNLYARNNIIYRHALCSLKNASDTLPCKRSVTCERLLFRDPTDVSLRQLFFPTVSFANTLSRVSIRYATLAL